MIERWHGSKAGYSSGWRGRRPAGDAPRSEAPALGLASYCHLDPSPSYCDLRG